MKILLASVSSFVLGLVLVVACSDDSPGDADAAVCDCPAAEPPITNARLVRVTSAPSNLPAGQGGGQSSGCSQGLAIAGSCDLDGATAVRSQTHLTDAGLNENNGYSCNWFNGSAVATTGTATVVCLVPAQ
jgi:hypothetical protein